MEIDKIKFNAEGLLVVVVQDHLDGEVLMLAWMNREALEITLQTKEMTYFSRSRQQLWRKGETSGNTQRLMTMSLDCDRDALLVKVEQTGVACHTGSRSCFFNHLQVNENQTS